MANFTTKDSGHRSEYESGMVRDTQDGKPRFNLMYPLNVPFDEQMLTRLAALMTRGIDKYGERNWEKADSDEELKRFKESAHRHFIQWFTGETDEDHAAAVMFNLIAAETVKWKMKNKDEKSTITVNVLSPDNPRDVGNLVAKTMRRYA